MADFSLSHLKMTGMYIFRHVVFETTMRPASVPIKTVLLLIVVLYISIFISDTAAAAGSCSIEAGPSWIKGSADGASLDQVLAQVAAKTGCAVYIDENLNDFPVSFDIQESLASEEAIRRMIHPHSYAMIYGRDPDGSHFKILEVRVYSRGRPDNVRYRSVPADSATDTVPQAAAPAQAGIAPSSVSSSHAAQRSGEPAPAISPRSRIKPRYQLTKGAFGSSLFKSRDTDKGPDYRPDAYEMRQAYGQFRQAKKDYFNEASNHRNRQSQANLTRDKNAYQYRRNIALKQYFKAKNH